MDGRKEVETEEDTIQRRKRVPKNNTDYVRGSKGAWVCGSDVQVPTALTPSVFAKLRLRREASRFDSVWLIPARAKSDFG